MRALHVFPFFSTDLSSGASHYLYAVTRELRASGVEVDVFTTTTAAFTGHSPFGLQWPHQLPSGPAEVRGTPVRRFPVSWSPSVKVGRAFSRAILRRWTEEESRAEGGDGETFRRASSRPARYDWMAALGRGPISLGLLRAIVRERKRYDVILVGYAPFALAGQVTMLARALRKPVVLLPLFHENDVYHHFRSVYRSLERADRVLVQTPYALDLFRRRFPRSTPVEIGVGVDAGSFGDDALSGARFRERYGLGGRPVILMVGRKEPAKRWDLAVEAIDRVEDPHAVLVILGKDVDGIPITSPRVRYLGEVGDQDLRDAFDACDVLVHPSENESFGIILLEAWMRGKPVVGNRSCGAVASVIEEGETGLLCAGSEELAAAIDRLLGSAELAARLGRAGRARTMARYQWSEIARRLRAVYEDVVAPER